jgi:hypothetical protein
MGKVFLEPNAILSILALHLHQRKQRAPEQAAAPRREGRCSEGRSRLSALKLDLAADAATKPPQPLRASS